MINLPSKKSSSIVILGLISFALLTLNFIGLQLEHYFMIVFFFVCFFISKTTRKFIVALIPFFIFAISYDWMRIYPNYKVNPIDIEGIYNLEKSLFGINYEGAKLTLNEYFAKNNWPFVDFLSGLFYFSWVPFPVGFAIYLYLSKQKNLFLRFSITFLLVNLIGFTVYYIYPAAPPWYIDAYGTEPILNTPGNMAGLSRFDNLTGLNLFSGIYGKNANVFAAVPSLHSAYLVVVLFFALKSKLPSIFISIIGIFLIGIWFTAIYTSHHYMIDVILGIICALFGIFVFQKILMVLPFFKKFINRYEIYIS